MLNYTPFGRYFQNFIGFFHSTGKIISISTHSPDFVNALKPEELFWLNKKDGCTSIKNANEDAEVKSLYEEGDLLGWLWKQNFLRGSGPFQ